MNADKPRPTAAKWITTRRLNGRWVRAERLRLKIHQCELAKDAGVSNAFLCDFEMGRRMATTSVSDRIEAHLAAASKGWTR